MLSLTTRARLRRAARDPRLDPDLRALLRLRLGQTGGEGVHLHVAQPGDGPAQAEAAVGWPLADEGSPQWEWALGHPGGWTELAFALSDDGPAQVLLVPPDADPALAALVRAFA